MGLLKRILIRVLSLFKRKDTKKKDEIEKKFFDNKEFLPIVYEYLKEGRTVTIRARGYSMRPFIEHDRDDLVLKYCDHVKERDVILAEIAKGHFVCHRIEKIEGQTITLRGDGNVRGTETCTLDDVRGKLVEVVRLGKVWNLESSRFWKIYSILWPRLLPVRRYLLAINKLFILRQIPDRWKR